MAFNKFGKGRRRSPGEMNSVESKYNDHLQSLVDTKKVAWFKYEGLKFKLADKTFFTPDFVVMLPDGSIELHEIKGTTKNKATGKSKPFVHDDGSTIKTKVAADQFPFKFSVVWFDKTEGWLRIDY